MDKMERIESLEYTFDRVYFLSVLVGVKVMVGNIGRCMGSAMYCISS